MNQRLPYPSKSNIIRSRSKMCRIVKRYNVNDRLVYDVLCIHCKFKSVDHTHNGAHMTAAQHRRDKALILNHGARKAA